MKIRTITAGIHLAPDGQYVPIDRAAEFNAEARGRFERSGYEVQTTRIATNPWEQYLSGGGPDRVARRAQSLEARCRRSGVDFLSLGPASRPDSISCCAEIIAATSLISCSATMGDSGAGIRMENVREAARSIKRISTSTANGYGNFRFCASANCPPGIPFFPSSYHAGEPSFSIGRESGDLAAKAFSESADLIEAETNLRLLLEDELIRVEEIALEISETCGLAYGGIDASPAPSLSADGSIAFAFERLGMGPFGGHGTLAIASLITDVLKSLPVRLCGYSGLMLPVCEDLGLSRRSAEGTFDLTGLLLYSTICSCGLDTVPLPGDIGVERIEAILLDVAALAVKLDKPLSARLLPVPGKKAGQQSAFHSPYLVDSRIFDVC